VTIEKAGTSDVPHIKELVDYYAKRGEMLPRSLSEIYEHLRSFLVYLKDGKVVGCCALYITWSDLAEIKSLAVEESHTGRGVGSTLVKAALEEARELGMPKVFTLTTKPEFFKKLGFKTIKKEKLPQKIWGECIRCTKFENCDEEALIIKLK